jgi:hypothetical protein
LAEAISSTKSLYLTKKIKFKPKQASGFNSLTAFSEKTQPHTQLTKKAFVPFIGREVIEHIHGVSFISI